MNKFELQKNIEEVGIQKNSYSLDGGLQGEEYVLSDNGYGIWSVNYSEKGERIGEKNFFSESEACYYLFQQLISDITENQIRKEYNFIKRIR